MRASRIGTTMRWGLGLAVAGAWLGTAGPPEARAEAPFYYDPLGAHVLYDPEFYPMNRTESLMSIIGQAWSHPEKPKQAPFDQDYRAEYRLRWVATLDPTYSLLIELKGSDRDGLIADDYFLKTEFFYQGLEAPLFLYGGLRLPEEGDFLFYTGIESMSYRPDDLIPGLEMGIPVGFRGFVEARTLVEGGTEPVLRTKVMTHTLPGWGVPNLTLSSGFDAFFQEGSDPTWILDGHAEYRIPRGALRLVVLAGYQLDVVTEEQRASAGVKIELF